MKTSDITAIALFAAFITVLGFIPPIFVPFFPVVPISVHSIGPMLAGALLGAKRGLAAVAIFWILALIGIGFAGGSTGLSVFMGPMGGYIWGFGLAAFVIGLFYYYFPRPNKIQEFVFLAIGGIFAIYAAGIIWLMFLTDMSLLHALSVNVIFIPGDIVKIIIVIFIRNSLQRSMPKAFK